MLWLDHGAAWVILILGIPTSVGLIAYRHVWNGTTWPDALRATTKFFMALFAMALALCVAMLGGASSALQMLLASFFIASSGSLIVVAIVSTRAPQPRARRWTPFWGLGSEVLVVVALFTVGYVFLGVRDSASGQTLHDFRSALYLSVITIATVGYGDVLPSVAARPLAMFEALAGYALLGVWVATIMRALDNPRSGRS